ncbi:MAG TPA: hypothetical protein VNK43_03610 [Gemmatimonadales bacterium]|nr:hypothetical protein [Gemmatimonadales bacterium]
MRWHAVADTARFRSPRTGAPPLGLWLRVPQSISPRAGVVPARSELNRAVIRHGSLQTLLDDGGHGQVAFRRGNRRGIAPALGRNPTHPM